MTSITKPVRRLTLATLDNRHGPDRGRRLVVALERGDVLVLRPHGTRRPETVSLFDIYSFAIRARVNRAQLEHARERKASQAAAAR